MVGEGEGRERDRADDIDRHAYRLPYFRYVVGSMQGSGGMVCRTVALLPLLLVRHPCLLVGQRSASSSYNTQQTLSSIP